ncbi:MAG: hypothetical protein HYY16_02005 [Planctomycetes bacterium]|nr:hypothetical protein [Planctomycetota bacterium]
MPDIDLVNLRIPEWIQIFVLAGIALVVIVIPLRIIWAATRSIRENGEKLDHFTDRLRARFNDVRLHRGLIGPATIDLTHEGRKATITICGPKSLVVRLHENPSPKFPCVITHRRSFQFPVAMVGLRVLPRIRTLDPLVDESVVIYTTPVFGDYLREMILDAMSVEGKASGLAENLVVLRRVPGVRRFRIWMAPEGALAMRLTLGTEDVFYRPEDLETVIHHLGAIYDRVVKN